MKQRVIIGIIMLLSISSIAWAHQVKDDRPRIPVTIYWSAPDEGAEIIHYNVFISLDGDAFCWVKVVPDTLCTLNLLEDIEYKIRVSSVSITGVEGEFSETSDVVYFPSGYCRQEAPPSVPEIRPNYPNPFNPQTTISYGIPQSITSTGRTSLAVYNLRGQKVKTFEAEQSPGWHSVVWYGDDDSGTPQASGVYYVRYQCERDVQSWKMTLVK